MLMPLTIIAKGKSFQKLNAEVRAALEQGEKHLILDDVNGQYYIGAGLKGEDVKIDIHGTPGNDAACYMDGPEIEVFGSAQDEVGNTMNSGRVIVHGRGGDVIGYGMRGGEVFIQGSVGYRVGIHMKEYQEQRPVIVIGECTGAFLGEYMAGGRLIVLGLNQGDTPIIGRHCGSGMHGGRMYIRGRVDERYISPHVMFTPLEEVDRHFLQTYIERFCRYFQVAAGQFSALDFTKIVPRGTRPYANLYTSI